MPPKKAPGPSAAEIKEINERNARKLVSSRLKPIKAIGVGRKEHAKEHPEMAKQLAKQNRAMAKVLPQEAREIARDLREYATNMNDSTRRVRQAPKARKEKSHVSVPAQSPVVAAAAAAHPIAVVDNFVEPDLAALAQAASDNPFGPDDDFLEQAAKAKKPGVKLLEKIHDMADKAIARAKAGESESSIFAYVDNVIGPEVDLYGAEYGSAGEAQELFESIGHKVIEAVRDAKKPKAAKAAGGAGGPSATEADKLGPRGPAKRAAKIDAQINGLIAKVKEIPLNTPADLFTKMRKIAGDAIELGGMQVSYTHPSLVFGKQDEHRTETETSLFKDAWNAVPTKDAKGLSAASQKKFIALLKKWGEVVHAYLDDPSGDIGYE